MYLALSHVHRNSISVLHMSRMYDKLVTGKCGYFVQLEGPSQAAKPKCELGVETWAKSTSPVC